MDDPEAPLALLLLFPTERLAPFASHFAAHGYDITLLSLGGHAGLPGDTGSVRVVVSSAGDMEALGSGLGERLLRPQIVIHDVGRDVLSPTIEGDGPDWRVDPSSSGQVKAGCVSWILDRLSRPEGTLWVNVFAGVHDGRRPAYCPGRYGLDGFEAAVHVSPRLRSLRVLNLCVTYFSDPAGGAAGCPHCLTAQHAPAIRKLGQDPGATARYVEQTYRVLGGRA